MMMMMNYIEALIDYFKMLNRTLEKNAAGQCYC